MSYSFAGYAALGATTPALPTVTGLVSDALKTVHSTPELSSILSPQAKILGMVKVAGLEGAMGQNISSIGNDIISHISDSIGVSASSIASDLGAAVPFIGFAVSAIIDVLSASASEEAARKQAAAQYWQEQYTARPVVGSGSNGRIVPADIFAGYHGWSAYYPHGLYRPVLGEQLMRITEELPYDTYDTLAVSAKVFADGCDQPKIGVPKSTRLIFRKLRQAIEAQWIPPYGSKIEKSGTKYLKIFGSPGLPFPKKNFSDGGVSLWPTYLDLLAHEIDVGHITECMIGYFSNHDIMGGISRQYTDRPRISAPILNLINSWTSQIHPTYTQDVAEFNRAKAQLQALMAAGKSVPKTTQSSAKPIAKPAAKMNPAAAIGAGAGVAALLALLFI